MDAIEWLLNTVEANLGVPARRITAVALPFAALLAYFEIFEKLREPFGVVWAHAITLCAYAVATWFLFARRAYEALDRRQTPPFWSFAAILLALGLAVFGNLSHTLVDRLVLSVLLAFVALLPGPVPTPADPAAVPQPGRLGRLVGAFERRVVPPLRLLAGAGVVALLTLSLPEAVAWFETPRQTAADKVGVWVAKFEGDEANETQQSLTTVLEAVARGDKALSAFMTINQLPREVALEGSREEQDKAAEEARASVNADVLLFGVYSKAQANVYMAVRPEYAAFTPFSLIPMLPDVPIDKSGPIGGAVYVIGKYVAGFIYGYLGDCANAERQFLAALDQAQAIASLKDSLLADDFRVQIATSVTCEGANGLVDASRLRQAIGVLEAFLSKPEPPDDQDLAARLSTVRVSASASLGHAYRVLAFFSGEPSRDDLDRAIGAYKRALTDWAAAPSPSPIQEGAIRSNLGVAYEKLFDATSQSENLKLAVEEHRRAKALLGCEEPSTDAPSALLCATVGNNLGVALQKLALTLDPPNALLKQAIEAYADAVGRLSKSSPAERVDYAHDKGDLADAYRLLAEKEDRDANLRQAREAIEDSLAVIPAEQSPADFAEILYKSGQIKIAVANRAPDDAAERSALADWACSLYLFDRTGEKGAGTPARALNRVRKRVGDEAFLRMLASPPPARLCPYAPTDILRLVDRLA